MTQQQDLAITDDDRPPLDTQKQQLESQIADWKRQGYALEMEIATLKVRTPANPAEGRKTADRVALAGLQAKNCYAAARRLTELREALPKTTSAEEQAAGVPVH